MWGFWTALKIFSDPPEVVILFPPECKRHAVTVFLALFVFAGSWADLSLGAVHLVAANGDNGDRFGAAATELEDINSDGRWEFLVGSPDDQTAGLDAGAVFLWFGGDALTVAPDQIWEGTSPEKFGFAVARIGDVNNDGTADWAVGAPSSNAGGLESGRVYVFFGSANPSTTADVIIDGATGGDQFGYAISAAGDFNGDGKDDFIVGAPFNNQRAQNAGAAYVIYGGNSGPSSNLADATVLTGQIADDNFGWSVSDAGNFLGGPEMCVAVGAPLNNTHGGLDAGAVYVFEGRLAGATPDTTIDFAVGIGSAAKANSSFGFSVREVSSFDGDGYSDLAVGAPLCDESGLDAGRMEIFRGGISPAVTAYRYVNGAAGGDQFGYSVARVYDVLGSGLDDVLIGAPYHDSTATNGGRAYLFAGGSASQSSAANLDEIPVIPLQTGTSADDEFGLAVSSAGDFDGDGQWDYAVGAPGGNNLSASTGGYCYLVDSSIGVVANTLSLWDAGWDDQGTARVDFQVTIPARDVQVLILSRMVMSRGQLVSGDVIWDAPASMPGLCPAGVCVEVTTMGYGLRDPGAAAALTDGGSLAYDLTVLLDDGTTLNLGLQPGPAADEAPTVRTANLQIENIWPNPANPQVNISYRAQRGAEVSVRVVDVRGRLIRTLNADTGSGDSQRLTWNGKDDSGRMAASGLYLIQVQTAMDKQVRPVVLAR